MGLSSLYHFTVYGNPFAFQFILMAYVVSIKRASALLIVLYSSFFLNEKKYFKTRLIGIIIISIGLVLIAIS